MPVLLKRTGLYVTDARTSVLGFVGKLLFRRKCDLGQTLSVDCNSLATEGMQWREIVSRMNNGI